MKSYKAILEAAAIAQNMKILFTKQMHANSLDS